MSLLFWEGQEDTKTVKWKEKHVGEDNEWKPTFSATISRLFGESPCYFCQVQQDIFELQ